MVSFERTVSVEEPVFRPEKEPEYRMPLWNFVIKGKAPNNVTLDSLLGNDTEENFRLMGKL